MRAPVRQSVTVLLWSLPLAGALLWPRAADSADERLPVPLPLLQDEAEKNIRKLFEEEYRIRSSAGQLELARKLLKTARGTGDDPTMRFVLLRESRNLAVDGGDLDLSEQAVESLVDHFQVDALLLKTEMLERALSTYPDIPALVSRFVETVDAGGIDFRFEAAKRMEKVARLLVNKTGLAWHKASLRSRGELLGELASRRGPITKALEQLRRDPDDPEANLAVGRYLCFVSGNWEDGLSHLARCGDPDLRELASKDLAGSSDSGRQAELGDAWWELGQRKEKSVAEAIQLRAHYWYSRAAESASGIERTELERTKLNRAPSRFLSDMQEFDVALHGKFWKAGILGKRRIQIGGLWARKGILTHPPRNGDATVKYRLGKSYKRFTAFVGLNDSTGVGPGKQRTALTFLVYGDGKLLWKSRKLLGRAKHQLCEVKISRVNVLELRVHCPGRHDHAHAVWLDPKVSR